MQSLRMPAAGEEAARKEGVTDADVPSSAGPARSRCEQDREFRCRMDGISVLLRTPYSVRVSWLIAPASA
jgi:hypothetical protein